LGLITATYMYINKLEYLIVDLPSLVKDQSRVVQQLLENNSQSLHVKLIEK